MYNNYPSKASDFLEEENLNLINSCLKLAELNSNIEIIIELIEKIKELETEADLQQLILNKAFNLIPEADFGKVVINQEGAAYFLEKVERKDDILLISEETYINVEQNSAADIIFKKRNLNKKLQINLKIDSDYLGAVVLYISAGNPNKFSENSLKMASILEKIASSYLTRIRYQRLQQKFKQEIILSLSNLLGIHDNYTKGHNQKVADISRKLAQAMKLNKTEIEKAYWTGILHDIGKTLIPAVILNKKTSLSQKEFAAIKKHPEWGYRTLKDSAELKEIAEYILYHHEHWDGGGYPAGLVGEEIPLISQIVAVADAWDAMCSDRSYRKALKKKEAVNRILKNRGRQFSPAVVDVFLDNIS